MFKKATKEQSRARVGLFGPAGAGKSYTGLMLARYLADGGKVAGLDTESGSLAKYSDVYDFDVATLDNYAPRNYVNAIKEAEAAGYSALLIDSLSHAWSGIGGALDMKDQYTEKSERGGGNSWTAWRKVTPEHNAMVHAILTSPLHIVCTCRVKMEYIQVKEDGKTVIKKIGLQPIQREGMEYEFDITADLDVDHQVIISKSRCSLMDGLIQVKPQADFWRPFRDWLRSGVAPAPKPEPSTRDRLLAIAKEWQGAEGGKAAAAMLAAFGWVRPATPTEEQMTAAIEAITAAKAAGLTLEQAMPVAGGVK